MRHAWKRGTRANNAMVAASSSADFFIGFLSLAVGIGATGRRLTGGTRRNPDGSKRGEPAKRHRSHVEEPPDHYKGGGVRRGPRSDPCPAPCAQCGAEATGVLCRSTQKE